MASADRLRPLLAPALTEAGFVLEDITVTPAGRRRVVRVVVDRTLDAGSEVSDPSEPLTLDEVADATHVVGDELDRSEALGESPYVLEVTSPGVDRPLAEPRHFQRNVGRLVVLTPTGGEPVTGRVLRAGADDLTVDVNGEHRTMPYAGLSRAVVQVEFSRRGGSDHGPGRVLGSDDDDAEEI